VKGEYVSYLLKRVGYKEKQLRDKYMVLRVKFLYPVNSKIIQNAQMSFSTVGISTQTTEVVRFDEFVT